MAEQTIELNKLDKTHGTIVFLMGAGCSADCGAPTMLQFMNAAREQYVQTENKDVRREYEMLFDFRRECLRVSYVFDRWWENIEDLFTQAHLGSLTGSRTAGQLCKAMTRVIWDIYRRPMRKGRVGYDGLAEYLHVLLEESRCRPVLMTTNYDLHLETAIIQSRDVWKRGQGVHRMNMERHNGNVVYPGVWEPELNNGFASLDALNAHSPAPGSQLTDPRLFEVIKLHGSVNWLRTGKKSATCDSAESKPDIKSGVRPVFECQKPDAKAMRHYPHLVPPMLGKVELPAVIREQWKRAVHAFRYAKLIVIAGYSFPETDTFMTRLMAEGIRDNDHLEGFIIVNRSDDRKWKRRVRDIFARAWFSNTVQWHISDFAEFTGALKPRFNPSTTDTPSPAVRLLRSMAKMP